MALFHRSACLAAAITVALTGQALAHAHLKSSTPAAESTVKEPPSEFVLDFSEGVNLAFTGITLSGPGEKAIATGKPELKAESDSRLLIPITADLRPGNYTVKWHALSKDGHTSEGAFTFEIVAK